MTFSQFKGCKAGYISKQTSEVLSIKNLTAEDPVLFAKSRSYYLTVALRRQTQRRVTDIVDLRAKFPLRGT